MALSGIQIFKMLPKKTVKNVDALLVWHSL